MTTTPAAPAPQAGSARTLHLSDLLEAPDHRPARVSRSAGCPMSSCAGAARSFPWSPGWSPTVGGREVFVPVEQVERGRRRGAQAHQRQARPAQVRAPGRRGAAARPTCSGTASSTCESAHLVKAADLELSSGWTGSGCWPAWTPTAGPAGSSAAAVARGPRPASGLPRLGQVRAADRARQQRAAARPVRPGSAGSSRPRSPTCSRRRPRTRRPRSSGRCTPIPSWRPTSSRSSTRTWPPGCSARGPTRRSPRCWPGCGPTTPPTPSPSCRSSRRQPVLDLLPAGPAHQGADADGLQPDQRGRPDGRGLPGRARATSRVHEALARSRRSPPCSRRR